MASTKSQFNTHIHFDQIEQMMSSTKIDGSDSSAVSSTSTDSPTLASPSSPVLTPMNEDEAKIYGHHMKLLNRPNDQQELNDAATTPIFTMPVFDHLAKKFDVPFAQYGLLAGIAEQLPETNEADMTNPVKERDARVFFNTSSPSSTFICGSQGSGKSHTLSCLLENALFPSTANSLPHPLTGLVFHYDTFISDDGGSPCEAAFLSSNRGIKVRVFCAPTNIATIQVSSKVRKIGS